MMDEIFGFDKPLNQMIALPYYETVPVAEQPAAGPLYTAHRAP